MNLSETDLMAAAAAVTAIWMCGVSSIRTQLRVLAVQTGAIAVVCATAGAQEVALHFYILAGVIFAVKSVGIPLFLSWAAKRVEVRQDTGVHIGQAVGLIVGCFVLAAGVFVGRLLAVPSSDSPGSAGMALALVFSGLLLMITRRLALTQVIGLLVMENGILLYSLTQTRGMPLIIEMGIVFEILVAVLIAGVVIFRLNRSFEHIDVTDLQRLRR